MRNSLGYTLTDLLLGLALLSVILLFSIPSISELRSTQSAKNAAKEISEFIDRLSLEAATEVIEISLANSGSRLVAESNTLSKSLNFPREISLRFGSESQNSIKLYSTEIARPGTIIVKNSQNQQCAVVLSLRNRSRVVC